MNDDLGERMKLYELNEAGRKFIPLLPVIARIDGRSFHSFTRGMDRPFDERLCQAMVDTTVFLVKETGACMGYTQSDEITLAWYSDDIKSQIFFDGRISKIVSQLGALATLCFYRIVLEKMPGYANRLPTFDARAWNVPNKIEGANAFLWREWDATKNSLSMATAAYYSHNECYGKNSKDKHEMLYQKGINWNDYPTHFKRGTYVQRKLVAAPFSTQDIDSLPPLHAARRNPDLEFIRSECLILDLPPIATVKNRVDVIFNGAEYEKA